MHFQFSLRIWRELIVLWYWYLLANTILIVIFVDGRACNIVVTVVCYFFNIPFSLILVLIGSVLANVIVCEQNFLRVTFEAYVIISSGT